MKAKTQGKEAINLELYQQIIGASPIGMLLLHLEKQGDMRSLRLKLVNEGAEKAMGYPARTLVGKTLFDAFPAFKNYPQILKSYRQLNRTGEVQNMGELEYEDEKLERATYNVTIHQLPPNHLLVCFQNITKRKQAEEALRESEAHFKNLIENANDAITVTDLEGNYLFSSLSGERKLGYKKGENDGKNGFGLIHPDDHASVKAIHEKIIKNPGKAFTTVCRYKTKKGEWRIYEAIGRRVARADDEDVIIINSRDITKRKLAEEALQESEERFRVIYNHAATGIARIGIDGEFLLVNKKLCDLFGYSEKELLNKTFFDLSHPDDLKLTKEVNQRFRDEQIKSYRVEKRYIHKKGNTIYMNVNISLITPANNVPYFVTVFDDITKRRRAQQKLEAANDEMSTFVYKASHDLKGPLASIIGLTNLANKEIHDKEALQYIDMISQSAFRLDTILTELLGISRTTQGVVNLKKIHIKEFIDDIIDSLKHAPYSEGVDIRLAPGKRKIIYSDRDMLTSILQNLIDNAIKYKNNKARKPFVKISLKEYRKGVRIAIEDNGSGIPKEMEKKVFEMFFRGHEGSQGTGLGLYIVRKSVEKLGGKLELKHRKGGGCRFIVQLPN